MTPLDEVPVGRRVRICKVLGDDGISQRLMELGFLEETHVTILSRQKGLPLHVDSIYGQYAMRSEEAQRLLTYQCLGCNMCQLIYRSTPEE